MYNIQPHAKPASVSVGSSSPWASAESQLLNLQASIAALREEMESIDKEKAGDKMLAEYRQWKDSEASAKSTWFRGQERWEKFRLVGWECKVAEAVLLEVRR